MRIVKITLIGMLLAAVIIPLPGHTAANSSPAPQPPAPQAEAMPANPPQTTAPPAAAPEPPVSQPPAPPSSAPQPAAPQPSVTPTAATPVSTAPAAPAGEAAAKPIEVVKNGELKLKLNFQDAPLQTVLEYLSETVGLTIVSSEPIASSRITVISRQPVTLDHAMAVINSILKEKGLTAVIQGKNLKVVSLLNAPKEAMIKVRTGADPNLCEPTDVVETWIIPIAHVTAMALMQNLQALLPEYANMTANADGNALIITDTTANIRRLMQIVKALDTHMATVAEIKVYRLRNADATSVATLINTIFQQQAQSSRGGFGSRGGFPGGGFSPFQMMMQMRGGGSGGMMGGRGGGPGGQRGSQGGGAQQGGGNINVSVVAAADTVTNSVVVRGPADSLALVDGVIQELDVGTKVATVRVYQLRYADAMNTADVVNQLFNAQSSSSSRSRSGRGGGSGGFPGGPMMFRGPFGDGGPGGPGGPGGTQGESAAAMVGVTAAADSRTNTIVVTGPEVVLNVVDEVIKKLDSPLANVADVKVFHLEYADASNTAQLVNDVFGQTGTTSSRSRSSRSSSQQMQQIQFRGGPGGGFGMMAAPGGQAGTSSADVAVVASADTRTNSVVVSGPQETLTVIAQIIKDLDENPAAERRIFVYALKNATATSLTTILNNLFQQLTTMNQRVSGTRSTTTGGARNTGTSATRTAGAGGAMAAGGGGMPGGGGATGTSTSSSSSADSLSEETYFQADPNTNSLLCMTSTKNYKLVKPIIEELDKPVGQVLIKVLFAELTHSNDLDFGSEFSMLNLNDKGGVLTIGAFGRPADATTPGSVFNQATNPNTLGPGATGSGGLSVRVVAGDLDLTLHALQDTGKLNVLSRPYVLTRNNRLATITVADEVPIPTGTTTVAGQTQVTFDYRNDIGIVLDVTPSINEDGLVNMIVSPKITTDTKQVVNLGAGLEPHIFSTRSASTRVAVKDGQTIVIGGLIQDQTSETVRKVPILGDIPLVGLLFKRVQTSKAKTELLIFLTPYVAKEPEELSRISDTEEQRSSLSKDKDAAEAYRRHMQSMRNEDLDPNQRRP